MHYLIAVLLLGVLIAFHETGHLLAARLLGVGVSRFVVGVGPAILTLRGKRTEYILGALPFGGYVRIQGMNPHESPEVMADKRSFALQAPWKRIVVLVSGSVLNHLLAIAALTWLFFAGTRVPVPMTIGTVQPGSKAARAQLRPGDKIVNLDGSTIESWEDLKDLLSAKVAPKQMLVLRQGEPIQLELKSDPRDLASSPFGINQEYTFRSHRFLEALRLGFYQANQVVVLGLATMLKWLKGQRVIDLVSLGVISPASAGENFGLDALLRMFASISVGLGVFNLLPIPALDGGRALFVIIESATGKPVNPKLETVLHAIGFLALLTVLLFLAYRDLKRFLA